MTTRYSTPWRRLGCAVLLASSVSACMTSGPIVAARDAYATGRPDEALELLERGDVAERDRLVMLMEAGTIAQAAGRFEDSIRHLERAKTLVATLETVDLSDQGAAVLINDRARRYPGEYAERLWIHTVQMLNFLALDDLEGAAVEARQVTDAYDRLGESVDGDVFTRALAARVLEAVGESGSAAIEYARAFEASGENASVARLALEAARRHGRDEDVERYRAALDGIGASSSDSAGEGRVWILLAEGEVPAKRAGNLFIRPDLRISFPYYPAYSLRDVGSPPRVRVNGRSIDTDAVSTLLGPVAERSLAARAGQLTARQTLRAVTKQGIGHAARHEDEVLGALVDAVLFLLEEADTRGWRTLPARWSFVEVQLVAGTHEIAIDLAGDTLVIDELEVERGRPTVLLLKDGPDGLERLSSRAAAALVLAARD